MHLNWTKDEDGDWVAEIGDMLLRIDRDALIDPGAQWECIGFFIEGALAGRQRYKTAASAKRAAERALATFLKAANDKGE